MIRVTLIQKPELNPTLMASHAGRVCYAPTMPQVGESIDVEGRLFNTGHHTTLQHSYFTFAIDNLSVASCCFGLHLPSPFYNSDQRSGRFSKMYNEPNFDEIKSYITHYYPNVEINPVMDFVKKGAVIYAENIGALTDLAAGAIAEERPFANEKYIAANAPKFAQEQLRMFISQVAPTALDFTVNLSTLTALYRTAWTPELKDLTQKMADEVIKVYPEIAYMFDAKMQSNKEWGNLILSDKAHIKTQPDFKLLSVYLEENIADLEEKDSVDTLHFSPNSMDDNINHVVTQVGVSAATFGQDQRHRTIRRSEPVITGDFYVPPLLKSAGLDGVAREYMQEFLDLSKTIPATLATILMPYGAMVQYKKLTSVNALKHEQAKRTCWCAQEEIYHISTALRAALSEHPDGQKLTPLLCPPCYKGKCLEGARFCGRQIKNTVNYFGNRRV